MERIPLSRIDLSDRRFSISYPVEDETLRTAISRTGLMHPVVLLDGDPLVTVAGLKRCVAASALSLNEVPAIVLALTEKEAAAYAVLDNAGRDLNIVEKGHAVERLCHFGFSRDEIYRFMEVLSLQGHEKVYSLLMSVALADPELKDFVAARILTMKNVEMLFRFTAEEARRIATILAGIHTTESSLREILQSLHLVKIASGSIDFTRLEAIGDDREMRACLRSITHPKATLLEESLRRLKEECGLPPEVDIKVDPNFEREQIDVTIRARDERGVAAGVAKIDDLRKRDLLRRIFDLTKGRIR